MVYVCPTVEDMRRGTKILYSNSKTNGKRRGENTSNYFDNIILSVIEKWH